MNQPTIEAGPPVDMVTAPGRRFSTNVAITYGTRLLMLVGGFTTSVIVARWLGPEGLGSLSVLNVAVALSTQIGCFGLPSANTYFVSQDRRKLGPVWTNSLLFAIFAGSILTGALMLFAKARPDLFGNVPFELFTIAAISIPFQLIIVLGLNLFLGINQIDRLNATEVANQLLLLLNAVLAVIVIGGGLRTLVSLNTATAIAVAVVIVGMMGSIIRRNRDVARMKVDTALFKRMLQYGIKFHISILAGFIIFRADLLFVNYFRGAAEAGVYSVAAQISLLLILLPGVIAMLLFPHLAAEKGGGIDFGRRVTRNTSAIMLLVCLVAVPIGFLLPAFYGPAFADVTWLLLILLPGIFFVSIESVLVQYFTATGLPKAIPLFWLVTLAIDLALLWVFVPRWGAYGAAIVSTISYVLIFLLVAIYFKQKTGSSFSSFLLPSRA
jgi:O-antigen/teichoic acid export membrane protein